MNHSINSFIGASEAHLFYEYITEKLYHWIKYMSPLCVHVPVLVCGVVGLHLQQRVLGLHVIPASSLVLSSLALATAGLVMPSTMLLITQYIILS